MRIFHASDPHIRCDSKHNAVVADKLAWVSTEMGEGDVLVMTGDITDDGREEQYAHALELLAPFAGRIVIVPGNHDFGPLGNIYKVECVRRFAKLKAALRADKPYMFRIDGVAVGEVICLDANLRTGTIVDFAQGKVGRWALWKLRRQLDAMRKARAISVVAIHHNPFYQDWFCRLQDAKDFFGVVLGRADIVLMGHEHRERHSWFPMNLPEENAQTQFWAAGSLQYKDTQVLTIPLMRDC